MKKETFEITIDNIGHVKYQINNKQDLISIVKVLNEQYSLTSQLDDDSEQHEAKYMFEQAMTYMTYFVLLEQQIDFLPEFGDDCPLTIIEQNKYSASDTEYDITFEEDGVKLDQPTFMIEIATELLKRAKE